MVGKLERQFDRYRKRGDVAALADVFDRTAPEVLRVARHLAPAGVEPEELVQETFLTAIRAADTYDRSRRLVPWLLGILGNQTRNMRRKVRRLPGSVKHAEPAGEPGGGAEVADPALEEAVASAVGDIPDPYRAVLVLHLAHGLPSAAIAESLDRPRATVRSQLQRGLKLLRKNLPPSMALGAAPIGPGLSALRTVVLAEASAAAVAPTSVAIGGLTLGGLLMTKPAMALGVALLSAALLGGGVFFASRGKPGEEPPAIVRAETDLPPAADPQPAAAPLLRGAVGEDAERVSDDESKPGQATGQATPAHAGGTTVEGRVLVQGTPKALAAAKVLLFPVTTGKAPSEVVVTTADANGGYRFIGVSPGLYQIVPAQRGYYLPPPTSGPAANAVNLTTAMSSHVLPPEASLVISKSDERLKVDLFLLRGHAVRGRVVDPEGNGLAGVSLLPTGPPFGHAVIGRALHGAKGIPLAVTDEAGAFHIEGLPPRASWVLRAAKKGWPDARSPAFALGPRSPTASVELVLVPGATLRGRVLDGDPGDTRPTTVFCRAAPGRTPQPAAAVRANADGTFEFVGVAQGTVTLHATLHASRSRLSSPTLFVSDLKPGEVREGLELRIPATDGIAGTVVDEVGQPVSGLALTLEFAGMRQAYSASTDEQGRFSFLVVPPGRAQLFVASGSSMVHLGTLSEDRRTGRRFVVKREPVVTLRGDVVDANGTPVSMAYVQVLTAASEAAVAPHMFVPARAYDVVDGQFDVEVRGFPPYTVLVTGARDARGRSLNLREGRVAVSDAGNRVTVRLEKGLAVAGSVRTAAGKPLAGVTVRAGFQQTQTDENGRFRFEGLSAGMVRVELAWVSGYGRTEKQVVEVGRQDVAFVLSAASKIAGRVLGPRGKPVAGSWVAVTWPAGDSGRAGKLTIGTGPDGRFEIDGIPAGGALRVEAAWPVQGGVATSHAFAPAVEKGVRRGTSDLELRFGGGLEMSGVVLDADGQPATACQVYLVPTDARRSAIGGMQVGGDGRWSIAGLEPKTYNVLVMPPNRAAAPKPQIVEAPASDVRFLLRRTLPLSGSIEGLGAQGVGRGPGGARPWTVEARAADGSPLARAVVMPGGEFDFAGLPVGESVYLGAVGHEDDRFAQLGPVKAGDKGLVLTVRVGQSLTVMLEVPEGLPVTRFHVEAKRAGWRATGRKQPDGRYLIRALPPGTYTIRAYAFGLSGRAPLFETERKNVDAGAGSVRIVFPAR